MPIGAVELILKRKSVFPMLEFDTRVSFPQIVNSKVTVEN